MPKSAFPLARARSGPALYTSKAKGYATKVLRSWMRTDAGPLLQQAGIRGRGICARPLRDVCFSVLLYAPRFTGVIELTRMHASPDDLIVTTAARVCGAFAREEALQGESGKAELSDQQCQT